MKTMKRVCTLLFTFVLVVSAFCLPVKAYDNVPVDWKAPFARFTQIGLYSPETGYNKAVQRFLYCFPSTHSLIADNGGIDGLFWGSTRDAVYAYQQYEWPYNQDEWDGTVGAKTWSKIANRLDPDEVIYNETYDLCYGNDQVYYLDTRAEGCTYYSYNVSSNGTPYREVNWFAQK